LFWMEIRISPKQLPISPMEALCNPGSRKTPENLVIRSLVRFNPNDLGLNKISRPFKPGDADVILNAV